MDRTLIAAVLMLALPACSGNGGTSSSGSGPSRTAGLNSPQAGGVVDDWLAVLATHSDDLPIELGLGLKCLNLTFAPSPIASIVVLLAPRFLFGSEACKEIGYCGRAPSTLLGGCQRLGQPI
jgi:hypothetical protein